MIFAFGWAGFPRNWHKLSFLQLIYVELGHAASALIDLVANWAGYTKLDNRGAFWTPSIYSARLSCRPYQSFSSSATHRHAKKLSAVL